MKNTYTAKMPPMTKYIIFTTENRHNPHKSCYANTNRYKTYNAYSREEAETLIKDIQSRGHKVTDIKTALGSDRKHLFADILSK